MSRLSRRSARISGANEGRRDSLLLPVTRRDDEADVIFRRRPESLPWAPVRLPELRAREVRRQDFAVSRLPVSARARPRLRAFPPFLSPVLAIRQPEKVRFCVRRKERREVLFALKRTGKGSRGPRRRTANSSWRC